MQYFYINVCLYLFQVKKEEIDIVGLHIKEENVRDGYGREKRSEMDTERERGMKESSEKKRGRETDREDHSMGDSSKEVRKAGYLLHSFAHFSRQTPHSSSFG